MVERLNTIKILHAFKAGQSKSSRPIHGNAIPYDYDSRWLQG